MKKILTAMLCILALAVSVSAVPITQLDYMDIGVLVSEAGHNVNGWSNLWTWGGNYGCGDDSNLGGGTLRTVIPRTPDCQQDDKTAYFSMSTTGTATELKLRHLQGSQNDNYELYYESAPSTWTKLTGSSSDGFTCGDGTWYTDTYSLPSLTGTINFKIFATINPIPSWCTSWGINAFSWAQLNGSTQGPQVPEFSAIAAGLALAGAATGFVLLRRRK